MSSIDKHFLLYYNKSDGQEKQTDRLFFKGDYIYENDKK